MFAKETDDANAQARCQGLQNTSANHNYKHKYLTEINRYDYLQNYPKFSLKQQPGIVSIQ